MAQKINFLRSAVKDKAPVASALTYGEIAINYNLESPTIYLKTSNDKIVDTNSIRQSEFSATTYPTGVTGTSSIAVGDSYEKSFSKIEGTVKAVCDEILAIDTELAAQTAATSNIQTSVDNLSTGMTSLSTKVSNLETSTTKSSQDIADLANELSGTSDTIITALSSIQSGCGLNQDFSCGLSDENTTYLNQATSLTDGIIKLDEELSKESGAREEGIKSVYKSQYVTYDKILALRKANLAQSFTLKTIGQHTQAIVNGTAAVDTAYDFNGDGNVDLVDSSIIASISQSYSSIEDYLRFDKLLQEKMLEYYHTNNTSLFDDYLNGAMSEYTKQTNLKENNKLYFSIFDSETLNSTEVNYLSNLISKLKDDYGIDGMEAYLNVTPKIMKTAEDGEACWIDYDTDKVYYNLPMIDSEYFVSANTSPIVVMANVMATDELEATFRIIDNKKSTNDICTLNATLHAYVPTTLKFVINSSIDVTSEDLINPISDENVQVNHSKEFNCDYTEVNGNTTDICGVSLNVVATDEVTVNYIHIFQENNISAYMRENIINTRYGNVH